MLILFLIAGLVKEISTRSSNEIIVYNTPGSSTIGIKTGKILNLYSDTSVILPEVMRHCAPLGLKINKFSIKNDWHCISAGKTNILICNSLSKKILQLYDPDIVILRGLQPEIESNLISRDLTGSVVLTSEVASGFHIAQKINIEGLDTLHQVRKYGAFIRRIGDAIK